VWCPQSSLINSTGINSRKPNASGAKALNFSAFYGPAEAVP
jgi:hypothetical protein